LQNHCHNVTFYSLHPQQNSIDTLPNRFIGHPDYTLPELPYPSDSFNLVFIHHLQVSAKDMLTFFSEIHRVLDSRGHLFFCFQNQFSQQRVKQLLSFTKKPKTKEEKKPLLLLGVSSCRKALLQTGFSSPHFYSFSPDCDRLSQIRDCHTRPQDAAWQLKPSRSLKQQCVRYLKNTGFMRDRLAVHYGVATGKQGSLNSIPIRLTEQLAEKQPGTSWQVAGDTFSVTNKGTFVFTLYEQQSKKYGICKIPLNPATASHLKKNYSELACIQANQDIPHATRRKIPAPVARSTFHDYIYFIEELKEGVPAVCYGFEKLTYDTLLLEAAQLITSIHSKTSCLDSFHGTTLIKNKITDFRRLAAADNIFFSELEHFLQTSLQTQSLFVAGKGDCSANNIIVDSNKRISGIIDWDQAQQKTFPLVDIINLIESFRRNSETKAMGQLVIEKFLTNKRNDLEDRILEEYCSALSLTTADYTPYAILYWLDHILAQDFSSISKDRKWMQNNVYQVVTFLEKTLFPRRLS
jgi:hypothetical protein